VKTNYGRYQIVAFRGGKPTIGGISGFDFQPIYFERRGLETPKTRVGRLALGNSIISHCDSRLNLAKRTAKRLFKEFGNVQIFNAETKQFVLREGKAVQS
jgi:hypothetical protein